MRPASAPNSAACAPPTTIARRVKVMPLQASVMCGLFLPNMGGSGPVGYAFEASKWRRDRARAAAADGGSICKAARARDRSHFDVPAGFDRFCPWLRQRALDRKSVGEGKWVAVSVGLGGRRIIKKKIT